MGHSRHVYYSICDGKKENCVNPLFALSLNVFLKSFNEINTIMNKRHINFYCNLSLLFFCNINGT
jgi:hypothetical protein